MEKYFSVLRQCPLFDAIRDENLTAMLGCLGAKVASFRKKETIMAEGERAKYIGVVLSGKAQIERTDYYGNRSIVTTVSPSELFGESFACAAAERLPFDVVATSDTEVMLLDCKKIVSTCSSACDFHNRMIFNLLQVVAAKNIFLSRKAEITAKRTTREKLMAYLLQKAKETGRRSFQIPFDRQALADYLEVDRSGLSAEISKLRREGVLESEKSRFRLL